MPTMPFGPIWDGDDPRVQLASLKDGEIFSAAEPYPKILTVGDDEQLISLNGKPTGLYLHNMNVVDKNGRSTPEAFRKLCRGSK